MDGEPKWRRRKAERPVEIIEAAAAVFAEKGYAAAKLADIAGRAGVSKAALYLYFETKEALFAAVARAAIALILQAVETAAETVEQPFAALVPALLDRTAALMGDGRIPAIVRMVIGESRSFPDLARIWHDDVVAHAVNVFTGVVARAQARGEASAGDPRLAAFSLVGPMLMAGLFRELFGAIDADPPDLRALAQQHARTVLHGLLNGKQETTTKHGE